MDVVALAKYKGTKETRIYCYNWIELYLIFNSIHLWKHGSHLPDREPSSYYLPGSIHRLQNMKCKN